MFSANTSTLRFMVMKKPLAVSDARLSPVGMHLPPLPVALPIRSDISRMPELKHESPMPCAVTVG
jgi:hypothetical protein